MKSNDNLSKIGVVGAGTMGAGIAQVAAQRGIEVLLYDINDQIIAKAQEKIRYFIGRLATKGRISEQDAEAAINRLSVTSQLEGMVDVQIVIEAAPERLPLKQKIFSNLETIVSPETILATNTSTLSITQIASCAQVPERVVGMHFFNPAALMPLVEVISGAATDATVMDATIALAQKMGKKPVRVKDVPGFIVNRVARPFHLEGLRLVEQGVTDIATVDRLIRAGGFKMGPFELQDLIGIDINYTASESVYNAFHQAPRFRPSLLQAQQVQSGKLGRKTGKGWY